MTGNIRRDESLTAVDDGVDIIEPCERVVYDQKMDDAEEASETDGPYIAIGDGLIKEKETEGESISLSAISVPHIDGRNQRIMKAVREAEESDTPGGGIQNSSNAQKQESVEKQTKGEIISLGPVSVPHIDRRHKRIMKVIREAEEAETPGSDIQDSSNVVREAEIAGGDIQNSSHSQKQKEIDVVQKHSPSFHQQRKQPEPGEQPDL